EESASCERRMPRFMLDTFFRGTAIVLTPCFYGNSRAKGTALGPSQARSNPGCWKLIACKRPARQSGPERTWGALYSHSEGSSRAFGEATRPSQRRPTPRHCARHGLG